MTFIRNLKNNWKLFKSTIENSNVFFNNYITNEELTESRNYFDSIKTPSVASTNTSYILKTNEIIYNNIKNDDKKWYFYDFLRNKKFEVYNIIFITDCIVIFIINRENPRFIVQNFAYLEIYYIGYIRKRALIQINHSTSGADLQLSIIEKYIPLITNCSLSSNNCLLYKQFIFFGFIGNIGHHLFNEVSGLNIFLQQNANIFDKIDGICIGPYDHFNMEDYLKKNYNFKIIKYNNNYIQSLNIFPIFLNSFILDKNIPEIFNKIIDYNGFSKQLDTLEIALDIRTCSRVLINIIPLYVNIINGIYEKYNSKYKIKIYFLGRFSTNVTTINPCDDKEFIQQNNTVLKILNNVNNNDIIFDNLIGKHFSLIFNKIMTTDCNICVAGSSISNLINWIYKKKTIALCCKSFYTLVQDIQYDCLQNYDVILPPIEYVKDSDNCNFYIIGKKFLPFLFDTLNSFGL